MAEMIPDRMPSGASAGERRVFDLLQKLPDTCIAYYEPVVGNRYPDFVIIIPTLGLLVIEVKGWYPANIVRADNNEVVVNARGMETVHKHPVRQAREYMYGLMDQSRSHPNSASLLNPDGAHAGRFKFPFGHVAVLSNIRREQLVDLPNVFPSPKVVTRDELEALSEVPATLLIEALKDYFDPIWSFGPLDDNQVSLVRSIIHPEIVVSAPAQDEQQESLLLKVLDIRQERNARSIGEGHRIVYGVAGSGKTVLLIARARLVAEEPTKRVLVLCFNRALAEYFQEVFQGSDNVSALNFHAWGGRNGVRFRPNEDEDIYGQRFLDRLERGEGDANQFDAVFIDEAQDFARTWFTCGKFALREPDDGDLLIVGDGGQSLYRRRPFTWRDADINAVGRTINTRFDLDKNYRNTREILRIAAPFSIVSEAGKDPDRTLQTVPIDEGTALRGGMPPKMIVAADRAGECDAAISEIEGWLNHGVPILGGCRASIAPSEIAVLYPRLPAAQQNTLNTFLGKLQKLVPVYWANNPDRQSNPGGAVTVRTIHSSKGLQYRAVLMLWSDLLPLSPDDEQVRKDRGLMYVGMTRAEDILVLTRSASSSFSEEIGAALVQGAI